MRFGSIGASALRRFGATHSGWPCIFGLNTLSSTHVAGRKGGPFTLARSHFMSIVAFRAACVAAVVLSVASAIQLCVDRADNMVVALQDGELSVVVGGVNCWLDGTGMCMYTSNGCVNLPCSLQSQDPDVWICATPKVQQLYTAQYPSATNGWIQGWEYTITHENIACYLEDICKGCNLVGGTEMCGDGGSGNFGDYRTPTTANKSTSCPD